MRTFIVTSSLILSFGVFAEDHQKKDLKTFLKQFHQNPVQVMEQLPFKKVAKEEILKNVSNKVVQIKDTFRKEICQETIAGLHCVGDSQGRAGYEFQDRAENLVDGKDLLTNLSELESPELLRSKLTVQPWSDDYWPIYKGGLAFRYGDPNTKSGDDWKEHYNYVMDNKSDEYIESGFINLLSPAEKYDLLVGDSKESLTRTLLSEGEYYYDRHGSVETWMGICHGWAPAAFMMDRPKKTVNVLAADGETLIPFYPSDIKSLASLLWAKVRVPSRFIGGRCNDKDPKKDPVSGRILSDECFDTNPATWHLSVINQIGRHQRSFIMDATFDYEVWNQPVYAYQFRYFNPQSYIGRHLKWEEAAILLADYTHDKFTEFRSPEAKMIVGVEMEVVYMVETAPSQREMDNPYFDGKNAVTYRYDLELDSSGNAIGGEWYTNRHPDFLWLPPQETRALTYLDRRIESAIQQGNEELAWKMNNSIPEAWRPHIQSHSRQGQPLGLIVEGLIKRANAE